MVAIISRLGIFSMPVFHGRRSLAALDASGIHATLVPVILGLMPPAYSWVSDIRLHAIFDRVAASPPGLHWDGRHQGAARHAERARVTAREALAPTERLEMRLHPWVAFATPRSSPWQMPESAPACGISSGRCACSLCRLRPGQARGAAFLALAFARRPATKPSELS